MNIININKKIIYCLLVLILFIIVGKIGYRIYLTDLKSRQQANTTALEKILSLYASNLKLNPSEFLIVDDEKKIYINLRLDTSKLNYSELKESLEKVGFKPGIRQGLDYYNIEFLTADKKRESMFAEKILFDPSMIERLSFLYVNYVNLSDNMHRGFYSTTLTPLINIYSNKLELLPSLSDAYGIMRCPISLKGEDFLKKNFADSLISISNSQMPSCSPYDLGKIKHEFEARMNAKMEIDRRIAFYSGHWVGTYTEEGKGKKELSIDLLCTYADSIQEPHVRGVLRLAYGTAAKVNLTGKLWEDGKVQLLDSNYISWEASPYYDGSKKIAGTFKGKMNGAYFKGKWFAEKKEEQKYFSVLSPEEERKSIEGFIIGEWLSDWYGNTTSNLTKFNADGSFRVENSARPSEVKVGTWKIIDFKSFELSVQRERILYEVNSIDGKNFVFKAKNKNWVPWKGRRKN